MPSLHTADDTDSHGHTDHDDNSSCLSSISSGLGTRPTSGSGHTHGNSGSHQKPHKPKRPASETAEQMTARLEAEVAAELEAEDAAAIAAREADLRNEIRARMLTNRNTSQHTLIPFTPRHQPPPARATTPLDEQELAMKIARLEAEQRVERVAYREGELEVARYALRRLKNGRL